MSDKTKRVSIDVSVNTKNADKSLKDLTKKLDKLSKNGVDIKVNINRNHYSKQINQFNASITSMVSRVNKDISNIKFNVNTNSAAASVNHFTANLTGAYGRIEKSSRLSSNRMNTNFNKSFSSITAMAKGMGSSIQSSFTNSFKGAANIIEDIKKVFARVDKIGSEAGFKLMDSFIKQVKARSKVAGFLLSPASDMGGLVKGLEKLGHTAGIRFALGFAKELNSSVMGTAVKKAMSFTKDALSKDYGSKLKSQGLRGKLTNKAIDATLPKELGSVVKKLSSSFLEAREDVRNFAKVCRQASDVINSGVIGRKFNRDATKLQESSNPYKSLAGSVLKELKTECQYLTDSFRITGKVLDPFGRTLASIAKPLVSATGAFNQTLTVARTAIESKVINPFNNFGNKMAGHISEFTTKISTSLDKFTDKMSDAADAIRDDEEAKGKGPGFFGKFQDSEGNFSWNKTLDSLDDVYKRLRDVYTQAKQTQQPLMTLANMGFDKASNSLSKGLIKALDDFGEADNNVDKACAGLEAAFYGAGLGAVKTFKKAFNLVPTVANAVKKLGKTLSNVTKIGTKIGKGLISAIKAPFRIARTFINIGKTIVGGISKGIRMGVGLIKSSINFLTGGIIKPVKLLANTISGIISSSLSLAKGTLSGLNAAIVDALSSDGEIELDVKVVGSNKLLGSLFDKRDVSNQLKRDLSLVTRTMPNELGKVTQVFGSKLIDAGNMVRQYANLMIQAYDFVRNNKGVIISTFNKLYSVAAPVVRRVVNALGTILKAAGAKIMSSLAGYLMAKIGPLGQLLIKAMTGLHGKFNELLDPSSKLRQNIEAAIPHIINFAKHVKDIAVAIFNAIKHVIDFGKALIDGIAKIVKFVTDIPGNIKKGITKGVDAATDVLATGFEVVLDKLSSMIDKLSHPIRTIKNASSKLFSYIRGETKRGTSTEKTHKNSAGTVYGSDAYNYSSMKNDDNDTKSSIIVDSNNNPIKDTQIKKTVDEVDELKSSLQDVLQVSDNLFIGVTEEQLDSITKSSYQFQKMEEFTRLMSDAVKDVDTNKFTTIGAATNKIAEGAKKAKEAFDNIGKNQNLKQATESLKQTGNQAKNLVKNIVDAKLAAQKVDDAFKNLRHPIEALRSTMLSKLGKFDIKLKIQGEKEAIKAATNVANAMNKFKNAKGSDKLAAGFDVAIQSIKYKLTTLKNTMKENFVSNLINKMSGKAKKASKELAENVPGGSKTIGFFKGALGKLALLFGGIGIANYIKQATDLAIQYEASAMQIQNSLGKASQKIMDFAQNSAAALGISQTDAMTYGNKFSLMVRQFEKDTDNIANTTNALMQAAAITASATGTELSTVMDSFQSALTGSSEAVDQYGLNMKIANLEARLGIDNWNDLTVAQQQFYITQELINQTTANFGNTTLKNTNSMLAQFKAQLSNTSLALGKAFKALLTVVLPYLTAFMKVLENVFNYISTMITSLLSLFGITVDFTSNAASGIEAVGGDIDTSGLDGVSEGMDNAADSADKAAESAEKMKGSLAGFDELNTLSFSEDSGSGSGDIPAGGIDTSGLDSGLANLQESEGVFDVLQDKLGGFVDWFNKLIEKAKELAGLFKQGFDLSFDASKLKDIWESLKSIGESLKYIFFNEEVAAALDNLANKWAFAMGQIVGAIANIGASIIQMLVGGIAQSLDENKDWIKGKLIECIDVTAEIWEILGNFAQALSEIFGVLGEEEGKGIIANIVSGLTYAFGTHAEIMLKLGRDILDLITGPIVDNVESIKENFKSFLGTLEKITGTIKDSIKAVCDTISQTYDEKIAPTLQRLRDGFSDTMAKFQDVYAKYIQPVLDFMAEKFDMVMDKYITPALQNLVSLFGTLIEVLGVVYETALKPLIDFIIQVIVPVAMPILAAAWNTIVTVVGVVIGIIGDLLGVLDGFLTFLVGIFQGDWEKAWGGLEKCCSNFFKIFKDIWDGICSLFDNGKLYLESFKNFFKGMVDYVKGRMEYFKEKIGENAQKAWDAIKKPFQLMGQWFKDTFTKALDGIKNAWSGIKTWASEKYNDFINGFKNLGSWCSTTFKTAYTNATNAWSNFKTWASQKYTDFTNGLNNLGSWCSTKFKEGYTNATNAWSNFKTWASQRYTDMTNAFKSFGSWASTTFKTAYTNATNAWSNLKTWASGLPTTISNGLSNLSSTMSSKFSSAWTACKNAFSGVGTWASGLASTIGDKFKNLGSTVGEAIGGAVKAAINGVISTIENVINGAISLINGAIKLINKIPGVDISTIGRVYLPRLASGGLVTSSTLANIGEAGPEAVIPLNRSSLWAPQLASELAKQLKVSGINQSNTSSRPLEVKLIVDGRELGRASINNINKLQRESNEILLDL